jgi:hypothetical protein
MRLLFALLVTAAALGTARADERLTLKLSPSAGWRLDAVADWKNEKGMFGERVEVIEILGGVTNDAGQERATPKIRLAVVDHKNREIYRWTVLADEPRVQPRQRVTFSARLESPPPDITGVEIGILEVK